MNLFVLDSDFDKCAQFHIDKHIVKIPVETAQVLCTANWINGKEAPYKLSHKNNPISLWVAASQQNYDWTINYGLALCAEYTYRYGRIHASEAVIKWCYVNRPILPNIGLTPHYQAMPECLRVSGDAVSAYRKYYVNCKVYDNAGNPMLKWTKRNKPEWINL
jgi:hypothetical protein